MATDKARERIEKEQDLRTQEFTIRSNQSSSSSPSARSRRSAPITAATADERADIAGQFDKAKQELTRTSTATALLSCAPRRPGCVKDLATHTVGTVDFAGTILMTLVPQNEDMLAEVWVSNQDVGFVAPRAGREDQAHAFTFQKYGMLQGRCAR